MAKQDVPLCAGEMAFVFTSDQFLFRATQRTRVVLLAFSSLPQVPQEKNHFQNFKEEGDEVMRTYKMKMDEKMHNFWRGVLLLIKESHFPLWLEKVKKQEFFYFLKNILQADEMLSVFSPLTFDKASLRFFVLSNYSADVTVAQLVKMSGMCRTNFYRSFKKEFGMSVYNWMQLQRAASVLEMASEQGMSVKKLMERWHFASGSNFVRFCKMYYKCSPRELINRVREGKTVSVESPCRTPLDM